MKRTAIWRPLICRLAALGTWWWLWGRIADVGVAATPLHVWADSPYPTRPFDRWATAAHTIQSAVDAAVPGDTVLVTNGIYSASDGPSEVSTPAGVIEVGKAIIVRSVNGPEVTIIRGVRAAAGGNGAEAVRGVYLGDGAVLSGFTITGGATREDGPTRNVGGGVLCASNLGTLTNCVLKENTASRGGGCYRGTLLRCTLSGNHAESGGGAEGAELHDCTVIDNTATWSGGGASSSTLVNCRLSANQAAEGGGTSNCKLQGCVLTFNRALGRGGGCDQSELNQCTVLGNSAATQGGGIGQGWNHLRNCIVYFNRAPRDPN
ncbi:MAG: hypothetical protein L6Q38_15135, partial [Nitrospira sp.]|nr:hypothetical protein [Nitrospira sp.]